MTGAPAAVSERQIIAALSRRQQELIILPTEFCNFRCTYCYEDFQIGKMSHDVRQGIMNLIRSRISELNDLRLSWFGGEPLVAKDVVLEIASFAKKLCDESNVSLTGELTTNAYRLDFE